MTLSEQQSAQSTTMKTTEKLTLIEGQFNSEEADEILTNIFTTKIHFHKMKNFGSQERYGKDDETAQQRIPALKKEMEKLKIILAEAKTKNKKLLVNSEITISLIEG
jgi:hypothetical protein